MLSFFNKQSFCRDSSSGQVLMEILVGISLLVLGAGLGFTLMSGARSVLKDRTQSVSANYLADEGARAAKSILLGNWSSVGDGTHGLLYSDGIWSFSGSQDVQDVFTRTIQVTSIDENKKEAVARVSWMADQGRGVSVEYPTVVTNWSEVLGGGGGAGGGGGSGGGGTSGEDVCGIVSGNWSRPRVIASVDLGSGRSGTDIAYRNQLLYVSSVASTASKKDFSIFDVSSSTYPRLLGEVDTGGGINEFVINGNYVYAVSSDNSKEFVVIDVSSSTNPLMIASKDLDGGADGNSVAYYGGYAIVGRPHSSSKELVVLNVTSSTSPVVSNEVHISDSVLNIYAFQEKLYYSYYDVTDDIGIRSLASLPSIPFLGSWDVGEDDIGSFFAESSSAFSLGGVFG